MHRFTVCCGIVLMSAFGLLAGDVRDAQRRIFDAQTVQPCDPDSVPPRDAFVTDACANGDFEAGLDTASGAYGHEDGYHIRTIQELLGPRRRANDHDLHPRPEQRRPPRVWRGIHGACPSERLQALGQQQPEAARKYYLKAAEFAQFSEAHANWFNEEAAEGAVLKMRPYTEVRDEQLARERSRDP